MCTAKLKSSILFLDRIIPGKIFSGKHSWGEKSENFTFKWFHDNMFSSSLFIQVNTISHLTKCKITFDMEWISNHFAFLISPFLQCQVYLQCLILESCVPSKNSNKEMIREEICACSQRTLNGHACR